MAVANLTSATGGGPGVSVSVVGERLDTYSIYAALS
jgi:hypothetical protein